MSDWNSNVRAAIANSSKRTKPAQVAWRRSSVCWPLASRLGPCRTAVAPLQPGPTPAGSRGRVGIAHDGVSSGFWCQDAGSKRRRHAMVAIDRMYSSFRRWTELTERDQPISLAEVRVNLHGWGGSGRMRAQPIAAASGLVLRPHCIAPHATDCRPCRCVHSA